MEGGREGILPKGVNPGSRERTREREREREKERKGKREREREFCKRV